MTGALRAMDKAPELDLGGQVAWTRETAWDLAASDAISPERLAGMVSLLSRWSARAGDAAESAHRAAHAIGEAAASAWRALSLPWR